MMKKILSDKYKNQAGFTLLEAIIGAFILSVGVLAVAGLMTTAVRNNSGARAVTEGSAAAADQMEYLITLPGWSFVAGTHTDLTAGSHQIITQGGYTVDWTVADNGPQTTDPDDSTQTSISFKTISVISSDGWLGIFGTRSTVTLNFIKGRDL
jgi:type II secretory pathway pseudopilin PulG